MATMARPQSYSYPFPSQGQTRYASNHGTSSAFSASANPNEDWTKISDLAERRRIQNRIAQRNYRKKLKRRLEDLERRAASPSPSPEQAHRELAMPNGSYGSNGSRGQPGRNSLNIAPLVKPPLSPEPILSEYLPSHDERGAMFTQQSTRQLSASPPPAFAYPTYPSSDATFYPTYTQQSPFPTINTTYVDDLYQSQPVSTALSDALTFSPGVKRESFYAEDDLINPFSMTYASMAGFDINPSQSYTNTNARTPSLTHSHSLENSRENSPSRSFMAFPSPPPSISTSPHLNFVRVS